MKSEKRHIEQRFIGGILMLLVLLSSCGSSSTEDAPQTPQTPQTPQEKPVLKIYLFAPETYRMVVERHNDVALADSLWLVVLGRSDTAA